MSAIHTVLVPVDFSNPSKKALQWAFSLVRQFDAKLVIAHIVADPSLLTGGFPTESHALSHALYELAAQDMIKLIPAADNLTNKVETIVRIGDIDAELLNIVHEKAVNLVVMGTHGRRNPARWFLGSVTERLLRQVHVPVLTISHGDGEIGPIRHILFASDLKDESIPSFRTAAAIAKTLTAKLTVIHVVEHLEYVWAGALTGYLRAQTIQLTKLSQKRLTGLVNLEKPAGIEISSLLVEGRPYEEILQAAKERHCDLIILNLQSKTALDRAFMGATAERVVRLSNVPVLSIPPAQPCLESKSDAKRLSTSADLSRRPADLQSRPHRL